MKPLDLNMSVYEATQKYPELIGIIAGWGFPQIRNNYLRRTVGRRYTMKQAIRELNLDEETIVRRLQNQGFQIVQ